MLRIQPDHRFINHEHLRIVHQGGNNRHSLASAMGKPLDGLADVRLQIESLDQFPPGGLNPFFWHLEQLAREPKELPRRQLVVQKWEVRHVRQSPPGLHRLSLDVEPRYARLPGGWL